MTCWIITQDLMLQSQCSQLARIHDVTLQCLGTTADLLERCRAATSGPASLVIVDLAQPTDSLSDLAQYLGQLDPAPRLIGVGPHVHRQLLEDARVAGWEAWTRGQLHAGLAELFRGLRDGSGGAASTA